MQISINIQNLGMFLLPTLFIGIYNILEKKSFSITFIDLGIIIIAAIFFSWLGNFASLQALERAKNP
jgi:hypothetical protein